MDNLNIQESNKNFPKIIHISHKTLNKLETSYKYWKELNPEYDIRLYDDEMCKQFLLDYFSKLHCDIFNFIKDGPIKCDFWRLCILYVYGGIYVDADIKPLVPLKEYIQDDIDFCTCHSYNYINNKQIIGIYNPHFIICKKNDDYIYNCISKYIMPSYLNTVPTVSSESLRPILFLHRHTKQSLGVILLFNI